jgi:glycosyltransferase involved in cell wall biosynthesis
MSEPLVSICCTTYNHQAFIGDAIESFLAQKTNFTIELVIHDDASTDGTADIIRAYEKKYPNLIKPIYQTENQHSKGLKISSLNNKMAKGKYLAICEGDDYWVDPYKLQKQVDYMETHPECSLCVHAAFVVLQNKKKLRSCIQASQSDKIFNVEEVIAGDGGLFATNSMLYPAKFNELPSFFQNAPIDLAQGFLTTSEDVPELCSHWSNVFPEYQYSYDKKPLFGETTNQLLVSYNVGETANQVMGTRSDDFFHYNVIAMDIRNKVSGKTPLAQVKNMMSANDAVSMDELVQVDDAVFQNEAQRFESILLASQKS